MEQTQLQKPKEEATEEVEDIRDSVPPNTKEFLPDEIKDKDPVVKLVYRYIRKSQNATLEELREHIGVSKTEAQFGLMVLLTHNKIDVISESESKRYSIQS